MNPKFLFIAVLLGVIGLGGPAQASDVRRSYFATVEGSVLYELAQFWIRAPSGQVYRVRYDENSAAQEAVLQSLVGKTAGLRGRVEELRSGNRFLNVESRMSLLVP